MGVDGCGLPTFWLSLAEMAQAWSAFALAMAEPDEDPLLARIGWAMARNPELTSGTDRIDLRLARRARQPWVGKIGALGVFCVALPDQGAGVVIKVLSGDEDALAEAVAGVVQHLWPGVLGDPGSDWPHGHVTNVVGRVVGRRLVTGLDRV
jgi:L-asparaginase II